MKSTDHFILRGVKAAFPSELCLHQCFETIAAARPQTTAIIAEDRPITYQEIDAAANRLAGLLRDSGAAPGALIGVCMARRPDLIAVLLAILKAGCAYVPLDPSHPVDRLHDIVQDTQAPFVFADPEFNGLFVNSSAVVLSSLGTEPAPALRAGAPTQEWPHNSDSLAYVIYTSGSTGRPKGVCCHHRGVLNLLSDFQQRQPIGVGDVCSWWTSLNFDVSVYEIFAPLVAGASLIIVPDSIRADAPLFMQWLYENRVSSCYIPPFMVADLAAWVEQNPGKSTLRRLLTGVEPIPERSLRALDAAVPALHIINGYGPTETTVCATLYSINQEQPLHANTPIGKPVQNMATYLLDQDGRPVAPDSPGELYIGGVGVARGYLNRPELNAERFLPDPYAEGPGAFMYRTGDMVRLLDDGNLEFLGRVDFQIKYRGFRIEPGEIETELRKLSAVREAVVLLRRDQGAESLVAYLALHQNQTLTRRQAREHLKRYLPDYMVPSAFVRMERMPTTPNGKTDRNALPPPSPSNQLPESERDYLAPQTELEMTVARYFEKVLGLARVGRKDHFFELGGHSLLATQLLSRIRSALAIELPLSAVFKAPTVEALALEIERLTGRQTAAELPPLTAGSKIGPAPLSFSQMRVWYLDQLEPGTPAYNICLAYRLLGPLEIESLRESFAEIVRRHESLRTIFRKQQGVAVQVVLEDADFAFAVVDLTHIAEDSREAEALRRCNEECHRGFDLQQGPLFRVLILRLEADHHVVLLTVHHIVSDGWSMGIIVRELMELYAGARAGTPVSLAPIELHYRDFARWQKSWMDGEYIQPQLRYWKDRFRVLPEPLELPADRPRPAVMRYGGASRSVVIDAELVRAARELSAQQDATLFMTLLSAFKALLHRYSHQQDLCVGTFIANRNHLATENMVGFFINSLAMRTEIAGDLSFLDLLQRVKDTALGAYSHQDLPFEKLIEEVNPPRDLSRTPLFQVMLVLQNMPLPPLALAGLECRSVELETFRSNFDLTLWLYETGPYLKAVMEYSTDLFEGETIARMLRHFVQLLANAVNNPEQRIAELALMPPQELDLVLKDWSGSGSAIIDHQAQVTQRFAEQAERQPDKLALVELGDNSGPTQQMTYAELNRRADQLAAYLATTGCGPETAVAVVTGRRLHFIVSILGVLKAGAAYVPIDPGYPPSRIEFILEDTQTPLIITDSAYYDQMAAVGRQAGRKILCVDRDWAAVEAADGVHDRTAATAENLAYIIYTSGSTGQPKGVLIEHRALSAFVQSAVELYQLNDQDRVLQFASASFDASIEEIFPTLVSGGTLLLRSDAMVRSMPVFLQKCEEARITVLDLPTAFWHQLVAAMDEGGNHLPAGIRLVVIGGEQAMADKVVAWTGKVSSRVRLINSYGPTETTVVATAFEISGGATMASIGGRVPIGKPLPHLRCFVLDADFRVVPPGVAGELHIGGAGLARGYLNQPEKSAESFVASPLDDVYSGRLYKTGDLVRYRGDGNLEFLGRSDRQVKVRGFRVELGEIEAALNRLPQVKETVVVAREFQPGPLQLAAYLTAASGTELDPSRLRSELGRQLPAFMVPAYFIQVPEIPINTSGKIDLRRLPNPVPGETAEHLYAAPRNPIEETLVEIWQKAFGTSRIGVKDNFFDLGGHSLLSIQIIDQVNRAGLWLTPSQFMQNQTIEQLARVITTARPAGSGEQWSCLVELQPHGLKPPLYLVHSTPGDVLGYLNLINHLGTDQPCYGLQSLGLKDMAAAHARVEAMAAFYLREVIDFQREGPYYLGGWCYGGIVAAEMALQLESMGSKVGGLVLIETPYPRMRSRQLDYYLGRLGGLLQMGPKGWVQYLKNRLKYRQKMRSGEIDKLFSLQYTHGPLANREQVYRLNWKAINEYRMSAHPRCPIRIFNGDQLEEGYVPDPQGLWVKYSKDIETYLFPGNHLTILKEPGVAPLAKQLKDCLNRLDAANS